MFESRKSAYAVASLVAARIIYAVNWLNIGPIYALIEPDLHGGVGGLGFLTATFYLGLGIFQVPGGILAARWGPRRIVTLGIMMASAAAIGTSLSDLLVEVAIFRFVVGAGMAFVFAPAVILVAMFIAGRRSGMAAGLFNSAFDVGGIFGLFVWILIAGALGWRLGLFLGGALGVATGALVFLVVPRDEAGDSAKPALLQVRGLLGNTRLTVIGFGILGTDIGVTLVSSFVVYYMINFLSVDAAIAGLVGGLVFGVAIFSTIWGGRLYDRLRKPKMLMLVSNLGVAGAVAACSIPGLPAVVLCTVLLGVASSVAFTVAFAAAKDFNKAGAQYDSLAVAWVNCIGLLGSFWPPLFFTYLVEVEGYGTAWLGGAGLVLLFTLPLLRLRERS
ncbi:MAG: MFS transporter [Thaumarchaeota archaeon]|nr:MFS transporter [Nitrososphaerota archaeon]